MTESPASVGGESRQMTDQGGAVAGGAVAGGAVAGAADQLRRAILRWELLPGEQLRQAELADQLRLSRVPVREALKLLEAEGLLLHKPNRGYYVRRLSNDELNQIYLMLDSLEELLLSQIKGATVREIDFLLEKNVQIERAFKRKAIHERMELNRQFHFGILSLSKQPVILDEVARLWIMAEPYRVLHLSDVTAHAEALEQHRQLVDAIKNKNVKELVALSKRHRQVSKENVSHTLHHAGFSADSDGSR
jgi:DNA-binding GntR family transcriptional regulator